MDCASAQERWLLHDFYEPSRYLTDDQARAHRADISKQHPSLPQRAGKAYRAIMSFQSMTPKDVQPASLLLKKKRVRRAKDYVVSVKALARPEPDVRSLARALINHIEQMSDEEHSRSLARTAARAKKGPGRK